MHDVISQKYSRNENCSILTTEEKHLLPPKLHLVFAISLSDSSTTAAVINYCVLSRWAVFLEIITNFSARTEVQTLPTVIQTLLIGGFLKDCCHLKSPTWRSAIMPIKVSWIEFCEKMSYNYFLFVSYKADEWICPILFSLHAMVALLKFFQYWSCNFLLKGIIICTQNKN